MGWPPAPALFAMQILLVRHAIADAGSPSGADADRALTADGRLEFERVARALAPLGCTPRLVLHSPLRRARETAEILAQALAAPLEPCPELAEAPSAELLAQLHGENVALVGHEPWLSALTAWLVAGRRELGPAFAFERGGCALLEGRPVPGEARLLAFLPPYALQAGPRS